jgi:hypothetical protein
MNTLVKMMLILMAGLVSRAEEGLDSKLPAVLASVQFDPGKPSAQTLFCAEGLASKMLAKAGVRVIWYTVLPAAYRGRHPILIDIAPKAPEKFQRGALAYTRPFEGAHITIFWDRLEGTSDLHVRNALLVHVLVHEITHILEGTNHHSSEGIMKARWTAGDMWQMARKPLSFDPNDVKLIHLGLAVRSNASK